MPRYKRYGDTCLVLSIEDDQAEALILFPATQAYPDKAAIAAAEAEGFTEIGEMSHFPPDTDAWWLQ